MLSHSLRRHPDEPAMFCSEFHFDLRIVTNVHLCKLSALGGRCKLQTGFLWQRSRWGWTLWAANPQTSMWYVEYKWILSRAWARIWKWFITFGNLQSHRHVHVRQFPHGRKDCHDQETAQTKDPLIQHHVQGLELLCARSEVYNGPRLELPPDARHTWKTFCKEKPKIYGIA